MIQRTFAKTGWSVPAIGFGAWNIGGQWGAVGERQAIDAVKAAYDAGVRFFDTADAYGEPPGVSEELVGQALRPLRDQVLIATKVGNFARRGGQPLSYADPLHVELCCDASLGRMKLDVIDLYQSHIGSGAQAEVFLEAFDRLLKKGKIRAFGVSTNNLEVVRTYNRDGRCAAVQLDYSYLNRSAERDLLPYCQAQGIGTIIRGPLAMGVATGKFRPDTTFTDSVRQGWNEGEAHQAFLQRLEIVEKVRFLQRPDRTMAQGALQFVISHPAVTVAIPGAKSPEQARANAAAGAALLDSAELEKVRTLTA